MDMPLVTIVIRTCGRPKVLKRALDSVSKLDYDNIEVVVVEDGPAVSQELITEQYSNLNIRYFYTVVKKGRCIVGNIALENAKGKYINFLDDDDILLSNHISVLVAALQKHSVRVVYSIAQEQQIKVFSDEEGTFKVKRKVIRYKQPFNRLLLCYFNYIPIQSVMFERSLYEELGGFDEQLDVLEDWDLWVRYATVTDFHFVDEMTSIFYTPYKSKKKKSREYELQVARINVIEKHKGYLLNLNVKQINEEMDYLLQIYCKKGVKFYLQKIKNYLLYKDI